MCSPDLAGGFGAPGSRQEIVSKKRASKLASTILRECEFAPPALYSASGMARRPLMEAMSRRKNTSSIERSLVCSRLSARGFCQ
jgi:hypothetical protein